MANQRDKNKRILGVYLDRETYQRLGKLARSKKTTVADLTRMHVERMVEKVILTPEDKKRIKEERAQAEAKQKAALAKKRTFNSRMEQMRQKLEG
jgi:predicted anti-sigma-YlaC factor YlaD